jgi:PKD repeat protein
MIRIKKIYIGLSIFLLIAILTSAIANLTIHSSPLLTITAVTDKQTYLLRQKVTIDGNITQDGSPATDVVVIIQAENPRSTPIAYRTLTIGNPTQTWPINITNLFLRDMANNPINTAKIGTQIEVGMTIQNWQMTARAVFATVTVFDANMVPLQVGFWNGTIDPLQIVSPRFSIYIGKWACSGKALITGNVYTKEPKEGGIALTLEKTAYFCISKTQQGLLEYPELPPPPPQTTPGIYNTDIRLSPEPTAGEYTLYIRAQSSPTQTASATITFEVQNSQGYPPQASFAYWPATPYENQTTTFDASSSTAEGYQDTIIKYEWSFGDGTPKITKTVPTETHNYLNKGTYIVTLNVTDGEGLWCATSKPIIIHPEFGPKANFTWDPQTPILNEEVTFDASKSTTGWSKARGDFSPIINYAWNFGDGTGVINVATPITAHKYPHSGNYTVTLTITDANSRTDQTWATVQVLNVTVKALDMDGNNKIDIFDVRIVAKGFGALLVTNPADPHYGQYWHTTPCSACPHPAKADVDKDGDIDIFDVRPVAKAFGQDP